MTRAARYLSLLLLATAASIAACRNNVPPPALPAPVAPELSREAPKPKPIDPKKKPAKVTIREVPAREVRAAQDPPPDVRIEEEPPDAAPDAAPPEPAPVPTPDDAGVSDVIDLPEVPDAEGIVTDAGTPLL